MRLDNNTILITGGASGIGLALAQRFVRAGSTVVVCGRRKEQLEQAQRECPGLHAVQCDVSIEAERAALVERVTREFPALNVLVNNAGVQNRPPPLLETQDWSRHRSEIAINLEAPMHLSMLLIPHLIEQGSPAILNVTSGLAFVPIALMPTYCATKAALHSFTLSLRYQLKDSPIRVIEVVPPAVNTDLGGKGLHDTGVPLDDYADHAMAQIEKGALEFGYQFSEKGRLSSREELDQAFTALNERFAKSR
ncbi:short-chain dehydrogenase [Sorangium cellulosum]|uniref:Short-chain dehydrogenase n=1 Tax=Sorangium cellulosum TaxID=56 RepID=A0A2L0FBB7_SORCE|nr:SDR family NAD(P)-dependent oxidoreductase [Sorangium cellulosum]AUX48797.1 short-chain dehydrogenase [Sorangium cellulosum]